MKKKLSITIVGGGAAGVSLFLQLVDKFISLRNKDISITVIERENQLGPGIPYSTHYDENILNMRYSKMSILPYDPNHVSNWINANKDRWKEKYLSFNPENDPYPPRSLYGIYLKDVFNESLEKAKNFGIECQIIHGEVIDIKTPDGKFEIILENQDKLLTDKVILCLGNYPPTTYQELNGKQGYFSWFWPDDKTVSLIPENATLGVLGTRATAIDISTTILSNRKDVKIILASRGGLLPKVQAVSINPIYKNILIDGVKSLISKKGKLSLEDLVDFLKNEIEKVYDTKIDWAKILSPEGSPLDILKQDIDDAKTGKSSGWQSILASTSDIIENFWHKLSDEDKKRFLEKYGSIWFTYRHAMPLKNAEKIREYLESGRLEIKSGIKSVRYDENDKDFVLGFSNENVKVPVLINATDAGLDIAKIDSILIKNLLRSAMLTPNLFGGINVDFETCGIINLDKAVSKNIYSIGYLTRGVHFYTNDVGRIAEHARRVVKSITENKS